MPDATDWYDISLDEVIKQCGWYQGTMADWEAMPRSEQSLVSFAAIGCLVAYPTWEKSTCVHLKCRIRRGELPQIAETNSILRYELTSGWLRFIEDREKIARIFRVLRTQAIKTGVYDPWKNGWQAIVFAAVQG